MASPQKENGYTPVANEIIDALVAWQLSSYEYRVFLFLIRKTYGWHKKSDWIALQQFVKETGIRENHVSRALSMLLKQNMVTKGGNHNRPEWGIQKDFDRWKRLPKGVRSHHRLPKGVKGVTKGGNSGLPKGGDTKETITKETVTKEHAQSAPEGSTQKNVEISEIIKLFEAINPACTKLYGNTTQRKACTDLVTAYGFDRVKLVVEKTLPKTNTMEYFPSITTPYELWVRWATLEAAIRKHQSKNIKSQKVIIS